MEQHTMVPGTAERRDHSMYFFTDLMNELYPYRKRWCDQVFKLKEKL